MARGERAPRDLNLGTVPFFEVENERAEGVNPRRALVWMCKTHPSPITHWGSLGEHLLEAAHNHAPATLEAAFGGMERRRDDGRLGLDDLSLGR